MRVTLVLGVGGALPPMNNGPAIQANAVEREHLSVAADRHRADVIREHMLEMSRNISHYIEVLRNAMSVYTQQLLEFRALYEPRRQAFLQPYEQAMSEFNDKLRTGEFTVRTIDHFHFYHDASGHPVQPPEYPNLNALICACECELRPRFGSEWVVREAEYVFRDAVLSLAIGNDADSPEKREAAQSLFLHYKLCEEIYSIFDSQIEHFHEMCNFAKWNQRLPYVDE